MVDTDFKIKTEVFEGPLDLLLSLIEKRKMLINDIALAQVTDEYIAYTERLQSESVGMSERRIIGQTSHFILIASTLLLIKSKSLLPTLELSSEEEESIEDLETRLKIYKRIKEAGNLVQERFGKQYLYSKRYVQGQAEVVFAPSKQITVENLAETIEGVIKLLPKKEKLPTAMVKKVISLENMMERLAKRVQSSIKTSFREFSGEHEEESRVNVIVSFLAMLELVKQGSLLVKQSDRFDDIEMETLDTTSTPYYG